MTQYLRLVSYLLESREWDNRWIDFEGKVRFRQKLWKQGQPGWIMETWILTKSMEGDIVNFKIFSKVGTGDSNLFLINY